MALDIKDRVPTRPGRIKLTAEDGTSQYYTMERADEPSQEGTAINKALLDDMCKAENTLVSSDVQTIFGKSNVDECLGNIPSQLKDLYKKTLIRTTSVAYNITGANITSSEVLLYANELELYDAFIIVPNLQLTYWSSSAGQSTNARVYFNFANGNNDTIRLIQGTANTTTQYTVKNSNTDVHYVNWYGRTITGDNGGSENPYKYFVYGITTFSSSTKNADSYLYISVSNSYFRGKLTGSVSVYGVKYND